MRFGLVLTPDGPSRPLPSLVDQALQAETAGFDLVWIEGNDLIGDPLVVAAALASATTDIRVGACCLVGMAHPIYVAEAAAVADLALAGRLVLGLRPEPGTEARFGEVVELVNRAHRAVPFAHQGQFWTVPGGLAGNRFGVHHTTAVTPLPAQLELPVWAVGSGTEVAAASAAHGVGMVADVDEPAAAVTRRWAEVEERLGGAVRRLARVARRHLHQVQLGPTAIEELVNGLRADQEQWAADTVLVSLPADSTAHQRRQLVGQIASCVRPRLVLPALPPGLVAHWQAHLGASWSAAQPPAHHAEDGRRANSDDR